MSKRKLVVAAIEAALKSATPDVPVFYWRDVNATRGEQITLRDTGASNTRAGSQHEHAVKVEIESLVVGENLGELMNNELDRLIALLNPQMVFPGVPGVLCELDGSAFDIVGDGMESGIVQIALTTTFRTHAWSGS